MKKLLFALLLITQVVHAQQQTKNQRPLFDNPSDQKANFINRSYYDTTAANFYPIRNYPFAQIYTYHDGKFWMRNLTHTAWILIGPAAAAVTPSLDEVLAVNNVTAYNIKVWDTSRHDVFAEMQVNGSFLSGRIRLGNSTAKIASIASDNLTANRVIQLPNAAGTVALTTDIPAAFNGGTITGNNLIVQKASPYIEARLASDNTYYARLYAPSGGTSAELQLGNGSGKYAVIRAPNITDFRIYELPDVTGVLLSTGSSAGVFPTLNQNTTGSAATLTTPRTINGTSFNGSANITIPSNITPGTSGNVLTSNGSAWTSAAPGGAYTVYTAVLNQSGTSNPTAVVLQNTFPGTVTWARTSLGVYTATCTGGFAGSANGGLNAFLNLTGPAGNGLVSIASSGYMTGIKSSNDIFTIRTWSDRNYTPGEFTTVTGGLTVFIEIRVYP